MNLTSMGLGGAHALLYGLVVFQDVRKFEADDLTLNYSIIYLFTGLFVYSFAYLIVCFIICLWSSPLQFFKLSGKRGPLSATSGILASKCSLRFSISLKNTAWRKRTHTDADLESKRGWKDALS